MLVWLLTRKQAFLASQEEITYNFQEIVNEILMQVPLLVLSCIYKVTSYAMDNAPFLFIRSSYK